MNSNWYQALILPERIQLSRTPGSDPQFDAEVARFRSTKWRSQEPFTDEGAFLSRLAADGLNEDSFLFLLGQSGAYLAERHPAPPQWLDRLVGALISAQHPPANLPAPWDGPPEYGFLKIVFPLLETASLDILHCAEHLVRTEVAPFKPGTICHSLLRLLPRSLVYMLSRTMVLEMLVARLRGQLQGESPTDRFQSFLGLLGNSGFSLKVLEEYPVLARQLLTRIDLWCASGKEVLELLCKDWQSVIAFFRPGDDPGELEAIDFGLGDMHCGGRSVAILQFASGFKLVYKPRPVSVHAHFNLLLQWIARHNGPSLPYIRVLDRGSYGWAEFIDTASCGSSEEAERFYWRQGCLIALLYALRATDFHSENVIAAGENPILVDLETLFTPRLAQYDAGSVGAELALADSVMAVGLLPQRTKGVGEFPTFEFSGLGGHAGQLVAHNIPHWERSGTDEMKLARRPGRLKAFPNLPRLHGQQLNVVDYKQVLADGFTEMYWFLAHNRDALLARGGPIEAFAMDDVRVIIRPTRLYGRILDESFHPDLLRNALDRERLFDRLWFGVRRWPEYLKKRSPEIIAAERAELWSGDMPYFRATVSGHDLFAGNQMCLKDILTVSGADAVRERFMMLGEEDFDLQIRLLRGSLAVLAVNQEPVWPRGTTLRATGVFSRDRVISAAAQVGDLIEKQSFRAAGEAAWIGVSLNSAEGWDMVPLGLDFYSGVTGITLFLACLGRCTGERRYRELAEASWRLVERRIVRQGEGFGSIGAFEGWGGILYSMASLAVIWERSELLDQAVTLADQASALIAKDVHLDIVNGSAGCIGALLALHSLRPCDILLDIAAECGAWLTASAQRHDRGLTWPTALSPKHGLTGFSHGAAGIGWALMKLFEATGRELFKSVADDAFEFERSLFDKEHLNWPDLRDLSTWGEKALKNGGRFMTAWCHGAPGIGLSRLDLLRLFPGDTRMRDEVDAAIRTTSRSGFGSNLSLCHGDLGNLELLSRAGQWLDRGLKAKVEQRGGQILQAIEENGFQCGVPLGIETPGLMVGLAGIGLGLLRLVDPIVTPCVLLIEPPGKDIAKAAATMSRQ